MATYTAGSLSANGTRKVGVSATDFHTRRLFALVIVLQTYNQTSHHFSYIYLK